MSYYSDTEDYSLESPYTEEEVTVHFPDDEDPSGDAPSGTGGFDDFQYEYASAVSSYCQNQR